MPHHQSLTLIETARLPGLLETPIGELRAWLAARGQPPHRLKQLRRWILVAGAESFDAMTDLPKSLRAELAESFSPIGNRVVKHLQADDGTHKLLVELRD